MKECPYRKTIGKNFKCDLLPQIIIPGVKSAACLCHRCETTWEEKPEPDKTKAFLQEELKRHHAYQDQASTILEQIQSAGKAAVKFAKDGFKQVEKEVYEERLAICKECDQYEKQRCKKCGCYTQLKLRLPHEQCPLDPPKWGKVT